MPRRLSLVVFLSNSRVLDRTSAVSSSVKHSITCASQPFSLSIPNRLIEFDITVAFYVMLICTQGGSIVFKCETHTCDTII